MHTLSNAFIVFGQNCMSHKNLLCLKMKWLFTRICLFALALLKSNPCLILIKYEWLFLGSGTRVIQELRTRIYGCKGTYWGQQPPSFCQRSINIKRAFFSYYYGCLKSKYFNTLKTALETAMVQDMAFVTKDVWFELQGKGWHLKSDLPNYYLNSLQKKYKQEFGEGYWIILLSLYNLHKLMLICFKVL